jgi:prepilin-type processing-associated H-X9-DG protein/prepilin-type N-terminal cleavage/methylation domain-containing protein
MMKSNWAAFTLIELLVVIAIIAVLAAILSPVMASSKDRARSVACVSNLRQLAAANLAYAAENDGQFAPAQEPKNRKRWHGERKTTSTPFDPTKGYIASYLGSEGRVKSCPAFTEMIKGKGTFEEGTGGYGYNAAYIGGTPGAMYVPERLTNVSQPTQTVMFTDTALPRTTALQEYPYAEPFFSVDENGQLASPLNPSVHFRHAGKANVAWCDGHVTAEPSSKMEGTNLYGGSNVKNLVGWFGPEANNGFWRP